MSNPFVAEIRIFAGNFAPTGWAQCNGQILPLSQNTALFSLLGTTYGGDGKSNFALPNMQGNAPMHPGQGPGLRPARSWRSGGRANGHSAPNRDALALPVRQAGNSVGQDHPQNAFWGTTIKGHSVPMYAASVPATDVQMSPNALSQAGNSLPHNNMPPYLALTFIIALQGVFPREASGRCRSSRRNSPVIRL